MQKTVTKKGQRAKSYSSFTVFLLSFWYLHFCFVCTWFFEDNFCNSWWIPVLFFAFCSVYQSWSSCQARLKKYYLKKYYSIFENTIWDSDEKILLVFLKNKSTELMQIISKYVLFDQNWKILHERWRYYSWQVSWEDAQKNTLIRFIPTYEEAPCNF